MVKLCTLLIVNREFTLKILASLCLFSLFMATSCLSPNHVTVQNYDLGIRENVSALNWKVDSVAYAGYRSEKILTREGQNLKEDHALRWKEEPDDLLKNFWLANFDSKAEAIEVDLTVLRFEFNKGKAEVSVLVSWDEGKKSKRVFASQAYKIAVIQSQVAAMSKAVDALTTKISQAVK